MPKPSAFMVRLQENQRHNMHLQRLFTIQQCEDMALITLNEDFGFGEKRKSPGWIKPTPPPGSAMCGRARGLQRPGNDI